MLSRISIRCTDRTQQIVLPDIFLGSSTETTTIRETATTLHDKQRHHCMRNGDNAVSGTDTTLYERIVRATTMYSTSKYIHCEFPRGLRLEWCAAGRTVVFPSERCRKYILGHYLRRRFTLHFTKRLVKCIGYFENPNKVRSLL